MNGLRRLYRQPAHRSGRMAGASLAVCVTVGDPSSWFGAGASSKDMSDDLPDLRQEWGHI